ncbi:Tat (twin-arginine translocation) pathway signal sequence [Desulfocicer vacuolatum DSM 3385]|uniref:Tat (Twin-arginine translocation) pathway signal sequence n=1 Tax=Desulfocicer vacuolatum DSM 3385 TaxID=1121400 RepID=A0A1W2C6P0_9BACT|nr:twin-arginine translocation signal domain-containing protein [Desulfocicer vacuolatum]SMC80917.1 Tat (twin-arginine translocation) pathway signal sequence [Desulfocicer vacuolatum DSM 3385]
MTEKKNRREFIKTTAATTVGVIGGIGLISSKALAGTTIKTINANAKSVDMKNVKMLKRGGERRMVMPDGSLKTRKQILRQLGFNPNTPPDAWLAGCGGGCGSNASGLDMRARERLMKRGFKFQGNELIGVPMK